MSNNTEPELNRKMNLTVRKQVESKSELFRGYAPVFDRLVRDTMDHQACLDVENVIAFGCGDSHDAAITTKMAYDEWSGLPMQAMSSLEFSRYTIPWLKTQRPHQSLVIGISVSGETARTIEGLTLAKEAGALTVAITLNSESRMANIAHFDFDVTVSDAVVPRVRTYVATQLALYFIALRIGEVNGSTNYMEATKIREAIQRAAEISDATNQAVSEKVKTLAANTQGQNYYLFTGGGPNVGSAMFSAAKIVEAEGSPAQGQDLEEWAHLQRFIKQENVPTFMIAPPGFSHNRAVEVAKQMKKIKANLIIVGEAEDEELAEVANVYLPVMGSLPEALTPLVYTNALEMFASDLAEASEEPYFRSFAGRWATPEGDTIVQSKIMESLDALKELGK